MTWDQDALTLIEAAPSSIRPMIRRKVEAQAEVHGLNRISIAFVSLLQSQGQGRPAATNSGELDISSYFARESGDPLTSAFDPTDDVHVFAGGSPLTHEQAVQAWAQCAQALPSSPGPRCLYIHVPFCRNRCVFCPFYANRRKPDVISRYAQSLAREIRLLGQSPLGQAPLDAVYFGGGTPSDLAPTDLAELLRVIRECLVLTADAEVTFEGRIWGHSAELAAAAVEGGVNRFSVGVQSFDTKLRRSLGRRAEREGVVKFLNDLAAYPIAVVIDLIFGLPGQTLQTWQEDLRCLTEEVHIHGADLYRLKSVPGSVMADLVGAGRLPQPATLPESAEMFSTGVATMGGAGWQRLSIPHWRRDGRERSRYNALVKAGADCIPIGCGASGRVGRTRFFQTGDLAAYFTAMDQGRKPIASAVALGPDCATVDLIAAQLEQSRLEPALWPLSNPALVQPVQALLQQWARAGLLTSAGTGIFDLTIAGQFWNIQMGARLSRLIESTSAGKS